MGVALGSLVVNAGGSHAFAVPGWVLGEGSDGITVSGLVLVVEWEGSSSWGWDCLGWEWSVLAGAGGLPDGIGVSSVESNNLLVNDGLSMSLLTGSG